MAVAFIEASNVAKKIRDAFVSDEEATTAYCSFFERPGGYPLADTLCEHSHKMVDAVESVNCSIRTLFLHNTKNEAGPNAWLDCCYTRSKTLLKRRA